MNSFLRAAVLGALIAVFPQRPCDAQQSPTSQASEPQWSQPENGLRARIFLKRTDVLNGTPIVSTFLVLQNVSDVANPWKVSWDLDRMKFRVVDAAGKEAPRPVAISYDGAMLGPMELLLPYHGALSFDISCRGAGIAGDKAAMIDLGSENTFVVERGEGERFLVATLEIGKTARQPGETSRPWSGRLELPPVKIPLTADPVDAAGLEARINELGAKMLANNGQESEEAVRALSLIDDPRVIPWYLKAMETNSRALKSAAWDRLSRFQGDEALNGIKKGMATQGKDIGNTSTAALAAQSAADVRHYAALALARSPHPDARRLLLSMWNDPYDGVKLTVLHALSTMDTPESLSLLRQMATDRDPTVAQEAQRYLKLRTERKSD
jgi:hypothetical protein